MEFLNSRSLLVKHILFAFNLLFWISGIVLIVVGALALNASSQYSYLRLGPNAGPAMLIVTGVLISAVACFGCCGAIRENICLLTTFAILLSCVIICEIAAICAAYAFKDKLETRLATSMENSMDEYASNATTSSELQAQEFWDTLQQGFQCCGAQNYTDWDNLPMLAAHAVPDSCCVSPKPGCGSGVTQLTPSAAQKTIYTTSCVDSLKSYLQGSVVSAGAAGVVIAVLQVSGIVLSAFLVSRIKRGYDTL